MEAPHNTSTSRAQHASRRWASSVGIGMSLQRNNEQARNQSGPTANMQLVQLVSEWVSGSLGQSHRRPSLSESIARNEQKNHESRSHESRSFVMSHESLSLPGKKKQSNQKPERNNGLNDWLWILNWIDYHRNPDRTVPGTCPPKDPFPKAAVVAVVVVVVCRPHL